MVTPILAALEDEAPLTVWALKMEVSIPDNSRKGFSHRATVLEDIGRFGFMVANNSRVSFPRNASYAFRVITGHSLGLLGKEGKKKVAICEPCLDCFIRD